jgi:hypothetical protein
MRHYALAWEIFVDEDVIGAFMRAILKNVTLGI